MKTSRGVAAGVLPLVYRGLIMCLALLAMVLAAGTVYGLFFRAKPPAGHTPAVASWGSGGEQAFTGIGRIRAPAKALPAGSEPGTVIIFVTFGYNPADRAFSEELAFRVRDFRAIISGYIGSFPAEELRGKSEDSIKAELLRRFNALLRLGQIGALYFSDFMIIG